MSIRTHNVELRHLPDHGVLLCTACHYCVLLRSLDRHLRDIHHLAAEEREQLAQGVDNTLVADAKNVVYPEPGSAPVPGLPVVNGLACGAANCQHLCMTIKRMRAHWRNTHVGNPEYVERFVARPVKMQTFFKSNNLQYFTVTVEPTTNSVKGINTNVNAALHRSDHLLCQNKDESLTEWLLIKRFADCSFVNMLPTKGAEPSWRDQMLSVCMTTKFLRNALLNVTACQIAFEHPASLDWYRREADKYRCLAIQTFFDRVSEVEPELFFAIFNFSRLMTISCLATMQLDKMQGNYDLAGPRSILPEWVLVQQRGRALIWPHRGRDRFINAMHASSRCRVLLRPMLGPSLPRNPDDAALQGLVTSLRMLSADLVDTSCIEALLLLRRIWTIPYDGGIVSFRDASLMWTARVPTRFLNLVKAHDAIALIVFAHFCVLWSYSEMQYWYMQGHAQTTLTEITLCLDMPWQTWIAWPVFKLLNLS